MSRRSDQADRDAAQGRCPVCGEQQPTADQTFDHVREEHPDAFAELSGLEVETTPERESEMDLVEWVESLTARAGRRRHW